jgi:hypothetical protein
VLILGGLGPALAAALSPVHACRRLIEVIGARYGSRAFTKPNRNQTSSSGIIGAGQSLSQGRRYWAAQLPSNLALRGQAEERTCGAVSTESRGGDHVREQRTSDAAVELQNGKGLSNAPS